MNKCTFIGNLTRDPELRKTNSDVSVVNFGLAINRRFKRNGETVQEVTFLDCEAWDTGADLINKFFQKGDPIIIEDASVRNESWEDKATGQKRTKLKFRVNQFGFPPKSKDRRAAAAGAQSNDEAPPPASGEDDGNGNIPF